MIEIEIVPEDLRILQDRLNKLGRQDLFQKVLEAIGRDIYGKASKYPPISSANAPPYPYWKRGTGTMYAGGSSDERSEKLGDRWFLNLFPSYVELGNRATYAGWVHGPDQARIHKERGWKQLLTVAIEQLPELIRKMAAQVERIWAGGS